MGSIEQHCVQFLSVARETRRTRGEEKVLVRGGRPVARRKKVAEGGWKEGKAGGGQGEGRRLEARLGARGGEGGGDTEGGAGKQNKRGKPLAIFH